MGERQGGTSADDAFISHGIPTEAVSGVAVDALLAAAVRAEADSEGEARAVAAFRAAREQNARTARTRRRDDWRPAASRPTRHSLRTTLAVLLSGLTIGGVAYAAVGSVTRDHAGDGADRDGRTQPSHSAPAAPGTSDTPGPTASAPGPAGSADDRPSPAQDIEAHCGAYERVEGRGNAMDSAAWQRLVDAAGGAENVDAYCAGQLDEAADGEQERTGTEEKPSAAGTSGNGTSGNGTSGNGTSGNGTSGNGATDDATKGGSAGGTDQKAQKTK